MTMVKACHLLKLHFSRQCLKHFVGYKRRRDGGRIMKITIMLREGGMATYVQITSVMNHRAK